MQEKRKHRGERRISVSGNDSAAITKRSFRFRGGFRQTCDLSHRPDLDRADSSSWNSRRDADCFVEILGVDEKVTAELFAGFRERTIGHDRLTLAHAYARRLATRMQRSSG